MVEKFNKIADDLYESVNQENDVVSVAKGITERAVFSETKSQADRSLCEYILTTGLLSKFHNRSLFISTNMIRNQLIKHLNPKNVIVTDFYCSESGMFLKVKAKMLFARIFEPEIKFVIYKAIISETERYLWVEYSFKKSFYGFAIQEAARFYRASPGISTIETTENGGKFRVDLNTYIENFDDIFFLPRLNCSILNLISFNGLKHSDDGIELMCDQNYAILVQRIMEILEN